MNHKLLGKALFYCLLCCIAINANGQFHADFYPDVSAGCAPLVIRFTNATRDASADATYLWDFGNGNKAVLKDPAAVYQTPGEYQVTLKVNDGSQQSVKIFTIQVYKKPEVKFSPSQFKGCTPLQITFTSNSDPGDGEIASWFWGYGDGIVETNYSPEVIHTYTAAAKTGVSLTVTNSYGCQSTLLQKDLINVLPGLITDFSIKDSFLCSTGDPAVFSNMSSGPGTLSYKWDFGDGESSVVSSPEHHYKKPGNYIATLSVQSTENGCVGNSFKSVKINVENFRSDFTFKDTLCSGESHYFLNTSFPKPTSSIWKTENGFEYNEVDGFTHFFSSPGLSSIKLINQFGNCKQEITKTINLRNIPDVKEPQVSVEDICGAPTMVQFKDSTPGVVKWLWHLGPLKDDTSTLREPRHQYFQNQTYGIYLTVFDSYGCKTTRSKNFDVRKPVVKINTNLEVNNSWRPVCDGAPVEFFAETTETIVSYLWDFDDGTTSGLPRPKHIYKPGYFYPKLKYKLANGCEGEVKLPGYIESGVSAKPDFKADSVNVCGNTPVTFLNLTPQDVWTVFEWHYGDGEVDHLVYNYWDSHHKYEKAGEFDVMLIARTNTCVDTIIKKAYIKVSPPFPKIDEASYTCEGTRGEVKIAQSSRQAESWHWDFGDGTNIHLTEEKASVTHTYTSSGSKKIVLTTTNGACTVADSAYIPVLLKQQPVLSFSDSFVCKNSRGVQIQLKNLDPNSYYYYNEYNAIESIYRRDGVFHSTEFNAGFNSGNDYSETLYFFDPVLTGSDGMMVVTRSYFFNCLDTSTFFPIKISGPVAGYTILPDADCAKNNQIIFKDTSRAFFGAEIKDWYWDFGENKEELFHSGGIINYTYQNEGGYLPRVTVFDSRGCQATFYRFVEVKQGDVRAAFSNSVTAISPGGSIQFSNQSTSSDPDRTDYTWLFGDGKTQKSYNASHVYSEPGVYKVSLIAKNTAKNCIDTATIQIIVKFVNAAFSYTETYIGSGKCPPVMVTFSNASHNIVKASWDFGDGTVLQNVLNPTHVYTEAGKYYITLKTWSDNGTIYSTKDSIQITGSSVVFEASKLHGCVSQQISLNAKVENVSEYFWDFGDGTVIGATDTFSHHLYRTPGIYNPKLVYADLQGCLSSVNMQDQIVIDSLSVSLDAVPASVCSPKEILLLPAVTSIGGNQSPQNLKYHWSFGNTDPSDTSNLTNPTLHLNKPGIFPVKLKINSVFGCSQTVTKNILVSQGLGGFVNGPKDICAGETVSFKGATQLPGQPSWQWNLPDGSKSFLQNTQPIVFNTAGSQLIQLIVNNNGCSDTIRHSIVVHPKPLVTLSEKTAVVCRGSALSITASGGVNYSWLVPGTPDSYEGETILVSPLTDRYYVATVKNEAGCAAKDSVFAKVIQPFDLILDKEAKVCKGESVQLNASGAYSYLWINQTMGLNSTAIANPLASPFQNTSYTVVGRDQYSCFTDTASVQVTVILPPQVNIGADATILAGTAFNLRPTVSNDARTYQWSPAKYLSCSDCVAPVATPSEPINYTLTVTNAQGCKNSDTIHIDLLCGDSKIYIPNIFTPNHDGKNDQFSIRGQGINEVRYLRIYNRFGQMIFEKKNFGINDPAGAWDGTYKGKPVDPGTYIYMTELSCNDKSFTRKGTVTISY